MLRFYCAQRLVFNCQVQSLDCEVGKRIGFLLRVLVKRGGQLMCVLYFISHVGLSGRASILLPPRRLALNTSAKKTFDSQLFSLIKKLPSEAKVCFLFSRSEHLFMPMNSLVHSADLDSFSGQGCFLALIVLHTLLLRSAI